MPIASASKSPPTPTWRLQDQLLPEATRPVPAAVAVIPRPSPTEARIAELQRLVDFENDR